MLDWLYEWLRNLTFYMILISTVLKLLPGKEYQKYIQFFLGLILILLIFMPVSRLFDADLTLHAFYQSNEYEMAKREMEMMGKYFENVDLTDFLPEEYQGQGTENDNSIEIDSIRIGQ